MQYASNRFPKACNLKKINFIRKSILVCFVSVIGFCIIYFQSSLSISVNDYSGNLSRRKAYSLNKHNNQNFRPLNILALGGSVTWGAAISNRYDAYPYLIGNLHPDSRVDNLAIRATGASYPASCIQSMIEEESQNSFF